MSSVNWWNYSINHLRDELRKRGLEQYGAKPAMIKRIQNYEDNYKKRMDALKTKQSSTYRSGSGDKSGSPPRASDYKVLDEWTSADEGKNDVANSGDKSTEKKEEKKEEPIPEAKKEVAKVEEKPPNYWGMTMTLLRDQCTNRGLSTTGSKFDIIDRLKQHDDYQRTRRQGDSKQPDAPKTAAAKTAASPVAKSVGASPVAKSVGASPVAKIVGASPTVTPNKPAAGSTTPIAQAKTPLATTPSSAVKATLSAAVKATPSPAVKATPSPMVKATPSPVVKATPSPAATPTPVKTPTPSPANQWGKPPVTKTTITPQASPVGAKATPGGATFQAPSPVTNEKKYTVMTFAQLKIECVNRKIEITGSKPDIIKRLLEHDKTRTTTESPKQTTASKPATPVKPVQTSFKYVQAKPMMMTKIVQSDLLSIDEPKPQEHRAYFSTEVVPYHAGSGRRKEWSNNKCLPDMTRDVIPDFETDTKYKTLVLYPVSFMQLLDPAVAKWKNNCKDFIIRFQDQTSVKKSMKGSVEMRFFTHKQVEEATREIQKWNKEVKVEPLSKDLNLDGVLKKLEARPNSLEPIVNRLLFLNKIAVNVKEGNLASKFLDAASVVIARDAADLTSKGYGYVEYLTRADAEKALKKCKPLEVDRCRIDVQMFNKVPSLVVDQMRGLVLPDAERIKLAESHSANLQMRIRQQGKSPVVGSALSKQIEKTLADLSLDAAIRKKLGFDSLPEPVVHQSAQQRNEWNTGVFKGVDLGSVKQIWADPIDAEAASRAAKDAEKKAERDAKEAKEKESRSSKEKHNTPPPAKKGRFDSSSRDARDSRDNKENSRDNRDSRGRDNKHGGRDQDKDKRNKSASRHDSSTRPGQRDRDRSSDDLRHKEPFNSSRQTSQSNSPSYMANQKTSTGGYQQKNNPPSLMGSMPRAAAATNQYGDRNQPGLLGDRKQPSLLGDRNQPGLLGDRNQPGLLGDQNQPGLLGDRNQPSLLGDRNQPGLLGDRKQPSLLGDRSQQGLLGDRNQPGLHGNRNQPGLLGDRNQPGLLGNRNQPSLLGDRSQPGLLGDRNQHGLYGDRNQQGLLGDRKQPGLLGDRNQQGLLGDRTQNLLGDRNPASQTQSLLGQPKSLMGGYAGAGRGLGMQAGRARANIPGMKPGLLGQPAQSSLMRIQPGGSGSPMDIDDSRSDEGFRSQGPDDYNRANRFDSTSNRFDTANRAMAKSNSRSNVPGLMDNAMGSNRFGQADKKMDSNRFGQADNNVPSLMDTSGGKDYGRSDTYNQGADSVQFNPSQRGGMGRASQLGSVPSSGMGRASQPSSVPSSGMGRASQPGGVPSLFDTTAGQRSSSMSERADDQYGNQRDTRGQFDSGRGAGRGQSLLGPRDSQYGGQTQRAPTTGLGARGGVQNDPYAQTPYSESTDDRMKPPAGGSRGRGVADRSRDVAGFNRPGNRMSGRFDDAENATKQLGRSSQSTAYGRQAQSQSYSDPVTVDPMDQPLQFRRTPGAKEPTDFGGKPRESLFKQPGVESYDKYGAPDPYGDSEPWSEQYDAGRAAPASLNRGVAAAFDKLRTQKPAAPADPVYAYGKQSQDASYGAKSQYTQEPYGVQDNKSAPAPYGKSNPMDTAASSRKSRFDQTTRAEPATKSTYDYGHYGADAAAPGAQAEDVYGSQRSMWSANVADPEPKKMDDDYYNAGVTAKYGSKPDPYSTSYAQQKPAYGTKSGAQSGYGSQSASYAGQSSSPTYQAGASRFGAPAGAKSGATAPWKQQESASRWGVAEATKQPESASRWGIPDATKLQQAASVPLEDMSVDLLKELSSQVSDLRSQLQSEDIPIESPKLAAAGDSGPKATYKSGAVQYKGGAVQYQEEPSSQYAQYGHSQYEQSDSYAQQGHAHDSAQSGSYGYGGQSQSQYGQAQYRRY